MRLSCPLVPLLVIFVAACSGEGSGEQASPTTSASEPATTASTSTATTTEAQPTRLRVRTVARGLDSPLYLTFAPGEPERLYVVEQPGRIRVIEDDRVLPAPFLDIASRVVSGGEQGLLSVAFHPNYAENHLFYVNYTDRNGDTRVVEYESRPAGSPARRRELLFVDQPYANHNGGQLQFGPDGRLYVGMGDGGAGGDPEDRAENLGDRLGKLLALDVDRPDARWRIVGYGLRNPWRFSFDRATGDLWIGDVGQGEWEEIDWTPARSPGLENYGWDVFEGSHRHEDGDPNPVGHLVEPVTEYSHDSGCSVTGGYVYRGTVMPDLQGRYFYGDFCSGLLWSLTLENGKASRVRKLPFDVPGLASFGEDAAGELYVVSLRGTVGRLVAR